MQRCELQKEGSSVWIESGVELLRDMRDARKIFRIIMGE